MGNLTDNVKVRQVGQSQVGQVGVAVTEKFRKQDGTVGESTEFFDIEIWNKPTVAQFLLKGTPVLVVGKIKTDSWQDQQGQTRTSKKVRVDTIQLCGVRPQNAQPSSPQYSQPAPPAPSYAAPAPAPQYRQAPPQAPVAPPAQPQYAPSAPQYNSNFPGGETAEADLPF